MTVVPSDGIDPLPKYEFGAVVTDVIRCGQNREFRIEVYLDDQRGEASTLWPWTVHLFGPFGNYGRGQKSRAAAIRTALWWRIKLRLGWSGEEFPSDPQTPNYVAALLVVLLMAAAAGFILWALLRLA